MKDFMGKFAKALRGDRRNSRKLAMILTVIGFRKGDGKSWDM